MKRNVVLSMALAMGLGVQASAEELQSILSKYPVELYGFFKLDAAYDTGRTDVGNFARWVRSGDEDDQFNMTANQTRFGLKFKGPDVENTKTSARVEVDFYEGGSENKSRFMMRHAYMQMDWPEYELNVIAGQTSDVIAPLVPPTLNYSVAWWSGDIGYRRPQVRVSKNVAINDDIDGTFQIAAARTIGDNSPFGNGADSGEDSGVPSMQGRAAVSFPFITDEDATVGLSTHWGEEEFDSAASDHGKHLQTWSLSLDAKLPLSEIVTLSGELWTGENLDAYLGGVAQGIVVQTAATGSHVNGNGWTPSPVDTYVDSHVIESSGGWLALDVKATDDVKVGLGASIDDPDGSRNMPAGSRVQNSSVWSNVRYSVNEAVDVGLELSYWDTAYKHMRGGDSIRVQTSFIYSF